MNTDLVSQSTFRRVVDTVLSASTGDDTAITLRDADTATLRFANNQVVQNVSVHAPSVSIRAAFGLKVGTATTNRLDRASLRQTLRLAEQIARVTPEDPEYLPPLGTGSYIYVPSYRETTAGITPLDLATRAKPVIDKCVRHNLVGAGILSRAVSFRGVAASSGLFAFERSTEARFSLTASADDSSGWTLNAHRDIDALGVSGRTNTAIDKALQSRAPQEIPPGHYTVILEPAAVAGIFGPFLYSLSAKNYYRGNSALAGRLNSVVLDSRLTVRTDPAHPDLLGRRFNNDGLALDPQTWVKSGVLNQLHYDRFTAKKHNVKPTPWPSAPIMTFGGPRVGSIDDLIAGAERAVLITNLWYIRMVDPTDMTVTGMTRDGTFLVEDGRIVSGLRNFRFHDSPLRCMQLINAATEPREAITLERGKMLLPALKLPDFHLSSVTRF